MAMAFALTATMAFAQENLVPNPSFELIPEDVESRTSRSLVCWMNTLWSGAASTTFRLICLSSRKRRARSACHATITDLSKPRMASITQVSSLQQELQTEALYLQVQLTEMLEEDQVYCVSFDLSLAEMSRYAVPDIGALLSDRKMSRSGSNPLTTDPDVKQVSNKTMRFSEGLGNHLWHVCGHGRRGIFGHRVLRRRRQHRC